ncbi:MAG: UbiA-like polyprenyltransferase [Bacillota bacterium]
MLQRVVIVAQMIRFEHTVFALPFAYIGALLVEHRIPSGHDLLWITLAMVGARTGAMSLNRIIDRHVDKANPRTAERALPRGILSVAEVWVYAVLSFILLGLAAMQLSPLAAKLFPFAVFILAAYSYTKRFTWACHLWLGMALGITPVASWIAIANGFTLAPVLLGLGVLFWVAGFDIIYACLDYNFDREHRIHSIPARFGIVRALRVALVFHVLAPVLFAAAGLMLGLGAFYFIGVGIAAGLLMYEHMIANPADPARINVAFFHVNVALSLTMFVFTLADVLIG